MQHTDEFVGKGVLDLKGVYKKAKKKMEKIKKRAAGGDDGMIDLKELEAWMKVHDAEHFLNITPEQMMSKYDAGTNMCVAVWCSVVQCVAVCCSVVQCVAVWYSVVQCCAACCSALQCAIVYCTSRI